MPGMDPEKMKEMQAAYQEAMKNPETAKKLQEQMKQMQGMMSNPMVQQQMQAMQNMVQNEDMQRKIAGLKDDPEFKDFFDDLRANGPGAMMKYSTDQAFLKKLNDKLGGEEAIRAAAGGGDSSGSCAAGRCGTSTSSTGNHHPKSRRYTMPRDTVTSRLLKIFWPSAKT